jgi:hypothetical protein
LGVEGHELSSKSPDFRHVSNSSAVKCAAFQPTFSEKPDFSHVSDSLDTNTSMNSEHTDTIYDIAKIIQTLPPDERRRLARLLEGEQ